MEADGIDDLPTGDRIGAYVGVNGREIGADVLRGAARAFRKELLTYACLRERGHSKHSVITGRFSKVMSLCHSFMFVYFLPASNTK